MADKEGTLLAEIEGFPQEAAERLAELWVTTAEELISIAKQTGGVEGLAAYLGVPESAAEEMVEQAVAALPEDAAFAFGPEDEMEVGLGALDEESGAPPEDELGAFGAEPLPENVDMRQGMPPVRNQGKRSTCVAHACAAVREYLLGGAGNDLSEQYLYWDCKHHDGHLVNPGTWINIALTRLQEGGICQEKLWPYNPIPKTLDEAQGPPPAGAQEDASNYRVLSWFPLEPKWIDTLRKVLADGAPVIFARSLSTG